MRRLRDTSSIILFMFTWFLAMWYLGPLWWLGYLAGTAIIIGLALATAEREPEGE